MPGATANMGDRIDRLIQAERWQEAGALIEKALKKEPNSHWLLTQLGETYYEEQQYKKALKVLLQSRHIVPDCPLTLWHLAGTLDALGFSSEALQLYTWLILHSISGTLLSIIVTGFLLRGARRIFQDHAERQANIEKS